MMLGLGCASTEVVDEGPTEERFGQRTQAASTAAATATVTVALPSGVDVRDAVPTANGWLSLRDRASLQDRGGALLPLYNLGSVGTELGASVVAHSVTSVGSVLLRSGARVKNNVTTAGTVTLQAGAMIEKQKQEHAVIPAASVLSWPVPLASKASAPRTVNPDASLTLDPGAYGKLTAYSRAKVTLRSGSYAFSDLQLEPDSVLRMNVAPGGGPVVLYVDKVSALRGKLESTSGSILTAESVLFVYHGTSPLRLEKPANMAVVAPQATVELFTGGTVHQGSVFAKGLHLEPDVKLTYVPFKHWDFLLPPRPFVSCVMPAGVGKYMAAFGYENSRSVAVTLPAGAQNQFVPPSARGLQVLTVFAPGRHEQTVWIDMPPSGVTWTLGSQRATATPTTPSCEFASAEVEEVEHGEARGFPSASLPYAPSAQPKVGFRNLLGPGRFVAAASAASTARTVVRSAVGGPTGEVPSSPDEPPDIAEGHLDRTTRLRLTVDTTLHGDDWPEGSDLRAHVELGGASLPAWTPISTPENLGHLELETVVPGGQMTQVVVQEVELNQFSGSEVFALQLWVDTSLGTFAGTAESAVSGKTWVFGMPFTVDTYEVLESRPVQGNLGEEYVSPFHGGNVARWRIDRTNAAPIPPTTEVRLCADWTAYYVDTAVPGALVAEAFPGADFAAGFAPEPLPTELSRLRGYDAAFAAYDVRIRGAVGSYRATGQLDVEGCTSVPGDALVYADGATPGSAADGVSFWMEVYGHQVQAASGGSAEVVITDAGGVVPSTHFGFNSFDEGPGAFQLVDGFRVPPARLDIAGQRWNDATSVAATMGRTLQTLAADGEGLPAGVHSVLLGGGSLHDTRDFECREVPDSVWSGRIDASGTLNVGPGFFPCAGVDIARCVACDDNDPMVPKCASGICDGGRCVLEGAPECRLDCTQDSDCPGGQHCAVEADVTAACDGADACFCAWAGQGSSKYSTAHEFGHMLHALRSGPPLSEEYTFPCADEPSKQCPDLPGLDPLCGCGHITAANQGHCLQSVERTVQAVTEGFAQYFASKVWNQSGSNCLMAYYKEFLDTECRGAEAACEAFPTADGDLVLTHAPVPIDCGHPVKWRNSRQCGVSAAMPDGAKDLGSEFDWMTFLRAVDEEAGMSLTDITEIYRAACQPENDASLPECAVDPSTGRRELIVTADATAPDGARRCYNPELRCYELTGYNSVPLVRILDKYGYPVYWLDRAIPEANRTAGTDPRFDRGGFLDGARRVFGADDQRTLDVARLGDLHGVSLDTAGLPAGQP